MLNVPELEQRWKKYRLKRRMPFYFGMMSILIASGAVLYFSIPPTQDDSVRMSKAAEISSETAIKTAETATVEVKTSSIRPSADETHSVQSKPKTSEHANVRYDERPTPAQPSVKLAPSMQFMNDFEDDVLNYYFEETTPQILQTEPSDEINTNVQSGNNKQQLTNPEKTRLPAISETSETPVSEHPKPATTKTEMGTTSDKPHSNAMLIQRDSDMKDIQEVIARFKKNKNPALSLFVAKRYYAIGNFQQAYNYALMTNELDNNIEDSWLIFAQSLYKLDQKEMAIKTLKTYINESGSVKARIAVEQMEAGSFQ